ncbi:MAG: HAD-IA family hydrolase [Alphaproteobacteria bacterium]|nr:HAD-IA family hydrolase [Alphaproteobacteria bacterium]
MKLDLATFPFRTIVFDLDGTLIDSARDVGEAVNRVLADHGLAPLDDATQRTLMGEGGKVRTRKAFALRGVSLDETALRARVGDFIRYYAERPVVHTRPYDGVAETLDALSRSGVRLAVCTNKYEASARDVLGRLDLMAMISDVAGADTFDVRKPDPGHVLMLLARMGAQPAEAAMVGDSVHDVHAGKRAGLPTVAVSWGYTEIPAHQLGADAVVERFTDIPLALARLRPPSP